MTFSSSSLFRLINAKCIVGSSSKWSARSCASLFNLRALSTATATTASDSSPWLMLPPEIKASTTSYKFYSLDDNKVQTRCLSDEIRNLRLTCRGSSHGWLALLSQHDDGFFLYNPISGRHIKLPSILNLPTFDAYEDILSSPRSVDKVILSCSPDEDEDNCRVLIVRNWLNTSAFCCPGRSKEWTLMLDENTDDKRYYSDCVYSSRGNLFYAVDSGRLETWDLGDLSSPKLIKVDKCILEEYYYFPSFKWFISKFLCGSKQHLVVAKEDLLYVVQYTMYEVAPDGACFDDEDDRCPIGCRYMTIGFDIFKYDSEKGKFKYLDSSSLGDLAIFVGKHSHSVAIQATEFPGVKPNSVYFTDAYGTGNLNGDDSDYNRQICGHDIGIYNYQDKTVSPCYYPCDVPSVKMTLPAPIWFFPSRTI
ncbi:hypothetical protein CASFOL_026546 [Castilleja foliolosa]|uniref:KIB1-4 beta-propeller domain-containing protein n=1 Tax=Castilleja foliolosa TaxID=1961234 RepID=A0ABD3CIF6_9LAMI